jgi:pentatricopeptide repeat protein
MLQKTLLSSFDTPAAARPLSSWSNMHHSKKLTRHKQVPGTTRSSVSSLCTYTFKPCSLRHNHRGISPVTTTFSRTITSSRRYRSSQVAKMDSIHPDELANTSHKKEMINSSNRSESIVKGSGLEPTFVNVNEYCQYWQYYKFKTDEDYALLFSSLNDNTAILSPGQQFKILRNALFQGLPNHEHRIYQIYQEMIDRSLEHRLEAKHYGQIFNSLKYGRSHQVVEYILAVLNDMKRRKPDMLNSYHYAQVLFGLSQNGEVEKVRELLAEMRERELEASPSHYTSLAIACSNASSHVFSVEDVIADFQKVLVVDGIIPERRAYNIIVELLCRNHEIPRAIKFLQTMESDAKERGLTSPDAMVYSLPDVYTYTSLISGFCGMDDLISAKKVLNDMTESKVSPNFVTYSILVNAYLNNGKSEEAITLINQMKNLESNFRHSAYLSLMIKALAFKQIRVADTLYKQLIANLKMPWEELNVAQRSAYVLMRIAKGDVRQVQRRFRYDIRHHPELLDATMINHIIRQFGNMGDLKSVEEAFAWFNTKSNTKVLAKIPPTRHTFHYYIEALFKCQKPEKAFDAVETMKDHGYEVDEITHALIIKGLVSNKEMDLAWKIFEMVRKKRVEEVEQNSSACSDRDSPFQRSIASFMSGLVDMGVKSKDRMKEEANSAYLLTNTVSELTSLDEYVPVADESNEQSRIGIQRAFAMLRDLKHSSLAQPNVYTYTIIIAGFAKLDVERAMQVFQYMLSDGIKPNHVVFTALIQGFAIARDAKGALAVYEDMRKRDISPNTLTWHYLLRAMLRSGVEKKYIDQIGKNARNGVRWIPHKHRTWRWKVMTDAN